MRGGDLAVEAIVFSLASTDGRALEGATAKESLGEGVGEGTARTSIAKCDGGINLAPDRTGGNANLSAELDYAVAGVGLFGRHCDQLMYDVRIRIEINVIPKRALAY